MWKDAIVETVAVRYARDEHGLLRFTTFGGGARISEEKLHEFNDGVFEPSAVQGVFSDFAGAAAVEVPTRWAFRSIPSTSA